MSSYQSAEILLDSEAQEVGASVTTAVSREVDISFETALRGYCEVVVSAVTSTSGAIELALQDSSDGGATWNEVIASAAIVATGTTTFRWNTNDSSDAAFCPLRNKIRVVATTDADDAITVSSVRLSLVD